MYILHLFYPSVHPYSDWYFLETGTMRERKKIMEMDRFVILPTYDAICYMCSLMKEDRNFKAAHLLFIDSILFQ